MLPPRHRQAAVCAYWQVLQMPQAACMLASQACHLCSLAHHAGWAGLSLVLVVLLALRHTEVIGPGRGQSPSNPQEDALLRNITGLEINPPEGAPCQHPACLPPQRELPHRNDSTAARRRFLGAHSADIGAGAELGFAHTWTLVGPCRGRRNAATWHLGCQQHLTCSLSKPSHCLNAVAGAVSLTMSPCTEHQLPCERRLTLHVEWGSAVQVTTAAACTP